MKTEMKMLVKLENYENTKKRLETIRNKIKCARAKNVRLIEKRINGEIQFRIGGEAVALHIGAEGTFYFNSALDYI